MTKIQYPYQSSSIHRNWGEVGVSPPRSPFPTLETMIRYDEAFRLSYR